MSPHRPLPDVFLGAACVSNTPGVEAATTVPASGSLVEQLSLHLPRIPSGPPGGRPIRGNSTIRMGAGRLAGIGGQGTLTAIPGTSQGRATCN
jgi:hypothetical protein